MGCGLGLGFFSKVTSKTSMFSAGFLRLGDVNDPSNVHFNPNVHDWDYHETHLLYSFIWSFFRFWWSDLGTLTSGRRNRMKIT